MELSNTSVVKHTVTPCLQRFYVSSSGSIAQDDSRQDVALPPQDRVLAVRPFWETVPQEERVTLLSLGLEELRERAEEITQRQLKEHGARQEIALRADTYQAVQGVCMLAPSRGKAVPLAGRWVAMCNVWVS